MDVTFQKRPREPSIGLWVSVIIDCPMMLGGLKLVRFLYRSS
jgi:hypothetical protein